MQSDWLSAVRFIHESPALVNQIEENIGQKSYFWRTFQFWLSKFLPFQINMDKFNYLQPLNDDNDLLAVEILLADDFPTYDVSFKQIVADFSPNIAAVPHGLESTGTKIKTTTTQRTRRSSNFERRYRRAEVCCSKQKYLLLDKTVDE